MITSVHVRISRSLLVCAWIAVTGCGPRSDAVSGGASGGEKPSVYVVNYPLAYFAERIGGESVSVRFPAPPGVDPAFWKPETSVIIDYQKADVILLSGADYAKWVAQATLPRTKVVDTSSRFKDRLIVVEGAITHSHGPEGEHSHAGTAFTTWLDLTLAVEQARAVKDALAALSPGDAEAFEDRFAALEKDLLELDAQLAEVARRKPDRPLLGSHPVYQYLARRYGLNLKSVHFEPDEMPDEDMWKVLEELLKSHPAAWMLWEGKPLDEVESRLRSLGVGSVVFAPCGNVPPEGDFLSVMRRNLKALERVFADA